MPVARVVVLELAVGVPSVHVDVGETPVSRAKVAPPTRRGFGTELVERALKSALYGTVTFDFSPDGLEVRMSFPFAAK